MISFWIVINFNLFKNANNKESVLYFIIIFLFIFSRLSTDFCFLYLDEHKKIL